MIRIDISKDRENYLLTFNARTMNEQTRQLGEARQADLPVPFPDDPLISRYDVPGPRYTSYPTVPHFGPLDPAQWITLLRENDRESSQALSLYLHLPFCSSLCIFCGCNVEITRRRERIEEYLEYLYREIDLFRRLVGTRRSVEQIHWGGGSPSYLAPHEIRTLGQRIRSTFTVSPEAEVSVEIDPRRVTREHVEAFREAGFNRASLGVQDFDPRVQEDIGRIQTYEVTRRSVEWLREFGFQGINLDLIYGLPHQTPQSFERTLDKAISLNPDRLAIFNFAYVPHLKRHQKGIDPAFLPSRETKLELLRRAIHSLSEAGYVAIGLDHFARADDELAVAQRHGRLHRNFQGYTTREDCDVIAFGVTGISSLQKAYAQNRKDLSEYYRAIDRDELPVERGIALTDDDRIRRYIINRLMCDLRLSIPDVERKFGIVFADYFDEAGMKLAPLVEDRLVDISNREIVVRPLGRFFLRNIAMAFDAYLGTATVGYSRTV